MYDFELHLKSYTFFHENFGSKVNSLRSSVNGQKSMVKSQRSTVSGLRFSGSGLVLSFIFPLLTHFAETLLMLFPFA